MFLSNVIFARYLFNIHSLEFAFWSLMLVVISFVNICCPRGWERSILSCQSVLEEPCSRFSCSYCSSFRCFSPVRLMLVQVFCGRFFIIIIIIVPFVHVKGDQSRGWTDFGNMVHTLFFLKQSSYRYIFCFKPFLPYYSC